MDEPLNSLNSLESGKRLSKAQKFVENAKRAVGKVLTRAWIGLNTMLPMASTTTSTVMPASINTISVVAPTASTVVKAISLWTAASLLTACGPDDPDDPINVRDTTPPTINISKSEVDITWGKEIRISWNQLYIWNEVVASRSDNKTKNCKVSLSINWKDISSWTTISEEWTLTIKVSDEAWNVKSTNIKLNMVKNAPSITVNQYEINIFWWVTVNINNNQLLFWDEVIASRNDDNLESCKVSLKFNWQDVKSWDTISDSWILTITVTNKNSVSSTAEITLKNESIYGLENLRNASIQVDKEINLLNWITFADGVELVKTEVETDGKRNTVSDPHHYTPSYPWTMNVIFTIKWKNWNTAEVKVDNLTIKPLDYKAIEVTNIEPKEILPIIWQVEVWDKQCYEHIEHLRIAEATRIRDMMREYGAGNHSPEEYQQLMMRLNTGMTLERPLWYDNYEVIWWWENRPASDHAHTERHTLNTLVKHWNFKIALTWDRADDIKEFINNNPNSINIFWNSSYLFAADQNTYNNLLNSQNVKDLCNLNNFIIFAAWTNIWTEEWYLRNKIYNWEYKADEHGRYSLASLANSDKNTQPNSHLIVTIATNKNWNIDQTNEIYESSKYPVWFKDNVLFSWRAFPRHSTDWWWIIEAESWKYATSHTNYVNVAIADLCFQMKADVPNVNQLLEMIRSTCLTDHIKFNGKDQPLQLMNPAWFFKKYLMPTSLPSSLQSSKTTSLNKWYYKWVIFDIPWAEVKINWQWVAYNNANKSQIKSQNPMTLEWRLNWDLCKKLWYQWKTVSWKIIVVDDKWNGLNIDKEFSVSIQ